MGEAREAAVDEAVAEVEVAVEVAVCKVAASSLRWFEGLRARRREVPNMVRGLARSTEGSS